MCVVLLSPPVWADAPTLTVSGQGRAGAVPDMAHLSLGVVARAPTAAEASRAMGQDMRAVLDALAASGVAGADVQTTGLSLHPVYGKRIGTRPAAITGFEASTQVTARLMGMDRVSPVLDAVLDIGVNQLNGIRFAVSDPAPLLRAARMAAMADARDRAQTYALAAGLELAEVRSIREGGTGGGPRPEMMMAARVASDMPVAAGEVDYSASVTVVYELKVKSE
ncbi:MAG: SIMPL domain-containing protein, partial [Primorskyibacter sp.]